MDFRDLIDSSPIEGRKPSEEARFSFLQGGYVEDHNLLGNFSPLLCASVYYDHTMRNLQLSFFFVSLKLLIAIGFLCELNIFFSSFLSYVIFLHFCVHLSV